MATYNLTGQKIKNTYGQLAQVDASNKLVDGLGNEKQIVTSSIVNFPTEVSRSAAAAGFGAGGGGGVSEATFTAYTSSNDSKVDALIAATSSYLTSLPSGVVSSSAQVDLSQATGTAANATSASYAVTASYALNGGGASTWDDITGKPAGLVSGSSQVSYTGITDVPSGIVSGAAQLPQIATNQTDIATLTAQTSSYLTSLPSGVVSSSAQVDLSQATGVATSASYAVTASYLIGGGGAAGLVSGTGTDSMQSDASLTTTPATASGIDSIALGDAAKAVDNGGIAIGKNAGGGSGANIGPYAVNIGYNSYSENSDYAVTLGAQATTGNACDRSVVIGYAANMNSGTIHSTALGTFTGVHGDRAVGIGLNTLGGVSSAAPYGIGIGYSTTVSADSAIGIGRGTTASGQGAIAIGSGSSATSANEINIGDKIKYNDSYHQYNLTTGSLHLGDTSRGYVISDWTSSLASNSLLIGITNNSVDRVNQTGEKNVQIGYNVRVVESSKRDNVVVIGADISAAQNAIAIGQDIENNTDGGVAIGKGTRGFGNSGIAIGAGAKQYGNYSVALGYNVQVNNTNEININDKLKYNSLNSGSFVMEGAVSSPTQTLSVVSSAVAVDGGSSNFFTLAAAGATATVSNPTNLMDGVTYTMKITNGANLSWDTNYNFEGGAAPTLTSGTDLVSFVSFGDGQLYCSYLLNLS